MVFGAWSQVRPIYLAVVTIFAIVLCISLSGLPSRAQAQFNAHPVNWHDNHQNWTSRCTPAADSQGRWGQQRQWDAWCKQNMRYHPAQPDQQWRNAHPWDHGNQSDHQ